MIDTYRGFSIDTAVIFVGILVDLPALLVSRSFNSFSMAGRSILANFPFRYWDDLRIYTYGKIMDH